MVVQIAAEARLVEHDGNAELRKLRAGPTPDSIMICGEPSEPAAMTTSPRQRAERSSAVLAEAHADAALAAEDQPLDQTAG